MKQLLLFVAFAFTLSTLSADPYGATAIGTAQQDLKTLQEKSREEETTLNEKKNSQNVPRKIQVSKDNPFYKDDNKTFGPNVFDRDPQ